MPEDRTVRLCVLGAGSVRCMPALIGSFATYFGERPLEIRFWDADAERLDLFDRFARLSFMVNKCDHRLISTEDPAEALEEAVRVVVAVGENCARKHLRRNHEGTRAEVVGDAVRELSGCMESDADVLSLVADGVDRWPHLSWPEPPTEAERRSIPHRLLRYLHEDEYLHDFFKAHAVTPIKSWLEEF